VTFYSYCENIDFYICFKEDEMGRACGTNGEKRNAYRNLVARAEEK
jgi:hypothetical protein